MHYLLNERYCLRGWRKLPFALVDRDTGRARFLRRPDMEFLLDCDGSRDLDGPEASEARRSAVRAAVERGIIRPCRAGEKLKDDQLYRFHDNRYIRTAHWSVTGRCNYRCKHCYMSAPDAKYGELDHDTAMSIARQIVDCGIAEVTLTGGEPLVRRDLFDIVDVLLDGGVHISQIYSNGRLVTEELLKKLEDRGIRPEFNMSFDGVGWHDWLRGVPGAEKYVTDAFKLCREHGFPTGAEMCIHRQNKHTLRDTVNFLASLGCGSLKTNPISNVGAWKEGGYGPGIGMEELFQTYLDYIPRYYEDGMPLSLQLGGFFSASPRDPEGWSIPSEKNCADPERVCVCGHARMVMYISAEGRALPCMALSGMPIQENYPLIPELGLRACITDSSYMRLIETRALEVLAHDSECRVCPHAARCLGGCRASALETAPEDILGRDMYACAIFRDGWDEKIRAVMEEVKQSKPKSS